jgi:hypothetical protein
MLSNTGRQTGLFQIGNWSENKELGMTAKNQIAGFAFLALVGFTGAATAADPKAAPAAGAAAAPAGGGDESASYKAKTVYDFEDDMVEGDLQRPDGELVNALKKTEHSSLIEVRKDFIPEMLKTLEDI